MTILQQQSPGDQDRASIASPGLPGTYHPHGSPPHFQHLKVIFN